MSPAEWGAATGAQAVLDGWVANFEAALNGPDPAAVAALFTDDCFWRDLVAFTWDIRTLEGRAAIGMMAAERAATVQARGWRAEGAKHANGGIEGWLTFTTALAHGRGYVRLRDGRCRTLLTAARALRGFEEATGPTRERGAPLPGAADRRSWLERRTEEPPQGRRGLCRQAGGGRRLEQLGPRYLRRPGRARGRGDDAATVLDPGGAH